MCEHATAEQEFKAAIALSEEAFGKASPLNLPAKLELGQFLYDIGQYDKSIPYFEEAFDVGGAAFKQKLPDTYYEVMRDYADALKRTDNRALAAQIEADLDNITVEPSSAYIRYPRECS